MTVKTDLSALRPDRTHRKPGWLPACILIAAGLIRDTRRPMAKKPNPTPKERAAKAKRRKK